MTIRCGTSLVGLVLWLPLIVWGAEQGKVSLNLPSAGWIEGVSSSPRENQIAAYEVGLEEEGETSSGDPILIYFTDSRAIVKRLSIASKLTIGTRPVWTKDGRSVYILSDDEHGVYRVSSNGSKVESLAVGANYGLALSPSGRRLAFWRIAPKPEDKRVLVVYDLVEGKEIRTWPVPTNFASESYGFGIAFADEDKVYAQTYDEGLEEVQTPLKLFDAGTGTITKITDRCSAVVATGSGIYLVTHDSGWKHFQLKKITKTNETRPKIVTRAFGFQGLAKTGKDRWLAVGKRGKAGLLDTAKNQVVNEVKGCDSVTMLADGRVIYVRKGRFSTDRKICR